MVHKRIQSLYYITHIRNVPSILEHGILSHERVEKEHIQFERVYDAGIVASRRDRVAPNGLSLWAFANLYFQPRNPMLYRVIAEKSVNDIAILAIQPEVLRTAGSLISIGNAASPLSAIVPASSINNHLDVIQDSISREWWKEEDGTKRTIMCECLVPGQILPKHIQTIYVANHQIAQTLKSQLTASDIAVIPQPHMFFQPTRTSKITAHLSVVEGDMFFSGRQTLTISVNCVGVMGKGLASRAKYQFPDVYVEYQDLCREKKLSLGQPYLYKRESSFDLDYADDSISLIKPNSETWFLLFPTKHHWKEQSKLDGIDKGLAWLETIYKQEGIKSLAMPALGCGLGGLEWSLVGPVICKYLAKFDIPTTVYLPTEKKIPDAQIQREFLLG